ncbi:uncharacterized protein [Henckelia pumila]|uniref:uncharacterized protein n=1 Tax=Henckelia pumila TaxID=405737 RepID=UPI003C6E81E4
MSRARDSDNLIPLDLEIESTLRRIRRDQRQNNLALEFESEEEFKDMAEEENNRTLMDLHRPLVGGYGSRIVRPAVQANTFELKPSIIQQKDGESLNAALTRFKKMLRVCPVHDLSIGEQVETLYYGVDSSVRSMLDPAANGSLYRKTPAAALENISNMAESNVGWQDSRREKKVGFLEMDALTAITAKLDGLTHQVSQLQENKSAPSKQVNQFQGSTEAVEGSASGIPFMPDSFFDGPPVFESDSVNYVGNQGRQQFNPYSFSYNPGWRIHPNFGWKQAENFVEPQYFNPPQQLAQQRPSQQTVRPPQGAGQSMPPGFKPSENKSNLEDMLAKYIAGNKMRWQNHDAMMQRVETQLVIVAEHVKKDDVDVEKAKKEKESDKQQEENSREKESLSQIPSYAKFLKEILSNKRKLVNFETVKLSEECLAILQNKLPPKFKDPGSFSIPCTIGNSFFSKALCDLGASINLMPYSCFEKLGIGEVKPTTISLQLADKSIKYPRGIVEDVLVKVDKFIFPVDFVFLDMEEDREIPLILGRPFLATGKALIDVQKGELVLRLNDERVVFNVFHSMKYPSNVSNCFRIDATDEFFECDVQDLICEDPLEGIRNKN